MNKLKQLSIVALYFIFSQALSAQTSTLFSGNWTNSGNWSSGTPAAGDVAEITTDMSLNTSLTIDDGGVYTVNGGSIIDNGGVYDITLQGGTVGGRLDVNGNVTILGHLLLKNSGKLIIRSGDTMRVGSMEGRNNTNLLMENGAVLIIGGDLYMKNNFVGNVDGQILVVGNFNGKNSATITGGGNIEVGMSTTFNNSSSAFGSSSDCDPGPCEYGSGVGLPVELLSFEANIDDSRNLVVSWETASEINNDYFTIFYSFDGDDFFELKRTTGAGNSLSNKKYKEVFANYTQSIVYLKLRQTDFDGQFKDYRVIAARGSLTSIEQEELTAYPNPTQDILKLKCHNRAILLNQVHLYNYAVQEVTASVEKEQISDSEVSLDLSPLPAGNYLLRLGNETHKIIKR